MVNFVHFSFFYFPSICSDKYGQERFLYQGECWESCPPGHYPGEGHTCLPCPDSCELCHNAHICIRCMGGYFLVPTNHTCQKLVCGQGKSALSHCLIPGGSMRSYTPGCPRGLSCLPGFNVGTWDDFMWLYAQWGQWWLLFSPPILTPFSGCPKMHFRDTGMQLITEKLILNWEFVGRV